MTIESETKERILQAALNCFHRFGFKKTTVEEIAKTAGVGKGTIYLHFKDKDGLFRAVIRHKMVDMKDIARAGLGQERDAVSKGSRMLRNAVQYLEENPLMADMLNPASENSAPHLWPFILECQAEAISLVEEILIEGVASGEMAPMNTRLTAWLLFNTYYSYFIQGMGKQAGRSEEFIELAERILRQGLVLSPAVASQARVHQG